MKKASLLLAAVLFSFSVFAQNDQIAPTLTKAELIDYLQGNYSVTNAQSYDGARDAMFEDIDGKSGEITCVYTGYTISFTDRQDAQGSQAANDFNTEHIWPQSFFDSDLPMRSDIHHLYPTRVDVNGARSNFKFDEIPDNQTSTWFRENSNQSSVPTENIDEYSELLNSTSFEPREDLKGNVARSIFYFWTIYQDNNSITSDDTNNEAFFEGMKDVLLIWHDLDPVDSIEVSRSIEIEGVQGNRNPFVHDTTLVRRAFFDGNVTEPDPVPNPVSGFVEDIEASSFDLTYLDGNQEKTILFHYENSITTSDTAGNPFTLTDYETILEAEIEWETGSSDDERIATSFSVIKFEEKSDTVITGPGASSSALLISGVVDATLTGGTPKAVELFVAEDIPDLGVFGIGSANNGGGSDGVEFMLSGSASEGSFIYVATESSNFNAWFDFTPDFVDEASVAINGDDAIELFYDTTKAFTGNEVVIDTFGEPDQDGSDTSWEYTNGWAYRKNFTGPDSTSFNNNNWNFSGVDALEGVSSNADADLPFPAGTYDPGINISNEIDSRTEAPEIIKLLQNYPNPFNPGTVISYSLAKTGNVTLKVYDLIGREVEVLVDELKTVGKYEVRFDGSDLPTGMYVYQLAADGDVRIGKMLLIK